MTIMIIISLIVIVIILIRGETRASTIVTIPLKIPLQNGIR